MLLSLSLSSPRRDHTRPGQLLVWSLMNVVERLHKHEMNAAAGPGEYLLLADASSEIGGGVVMGNYKNNPIKHRRVCGKLGACFTR